MDQHYDVIIIGTGAGGGTLAYRLAPSGQRILLLERGAFLPREKQNWDVNAVFLENRYVSPDTWYDHRGKPFQPGSHYFVGGATKLYGAALFRMRQDDFGELKHHDGISPAWPNTSIRCIGCAVLIPPIRRPVRPICSHRCPMSHVSRSYTMTWKRLATIRPRHPRGSSSMSKTPTGASAFAVT